jgi:hypothetical protein
MHQAIGLSAGPNWAPSSSSPHGLRYAASPSVSIAFYVLRMARSYGFIESASILLNGKRPSFVTSVPSHDLTLAREISPRIPPVCPNYNRARIQKHCWTADSITSLPVDDIAQRRAIKIGAQIAAE